MNIKEKLDLGSLYIKYILCLNVCSFHKDSYIYESLVVPQQFNSKQMFLTSSHFKEFIDKIEHKTICELTDRLNIKWFFFRTFDWITMIGPCRTSNQTKINIHSLLSQCNIPYSQLSELDRYCKSLFTLTDDVILGAIFASIKSICEDANNVFTKRINFDNNPDDLDILDDNISPPIHFVEYTHDLQSRFMEEISQGNTAEANLLLKEISKRTIKRTETRIASRNAGVPSQAVDALSSEFANRVFEATSDSEVLNLSYEMVERFCALVRQYRLKSYNPIIRKVIHFILMNLNQDLSVSGIAKSVDISPNYLSSVFKREVGMPLTSYIQNMRLEKAAHLLTYTTALVQDICASVGIIDHNYFTKLFKNKYKETPTEYRQKSSN